MPETSQINQFIPMLIIVIGLGAAWLVTRFVFKTAKRIFSLGCAGIVILGLILYMGATIIS